MYKILILCQVNEPMDVEYKCGKLNLCGKNSTKSLIYFNQRNFFPLRSLVNRVHVVYEMPSPMLLRFDLNYLV